MQKISITLKRKHVVSTAIIITTMAKKQLSHLGYQTLDQKSKTKYKRFKWDLIRRIFYAKKDKLIPNSHLGVYKLKFPCWSVYYGETKKIINRTSTRECVKAASTREHQR